MNKTQIELFHKYFTDLSNNNQEKYDELIKFSQDILNDTIGKETVIQIIGSGSNGKTTFIQILDGLADSMMKCSPDMLTEEHFSSHKYDDSIKYFIIEDVIIQKLIIYIDSQNL